MNSMIQNDYQQIGQNILQEMEGGFSGPETLPNKIEEPPNNPEEQSVASASPLRIRREAIANMSPEHQRLIQLYEYDPNGVREDEGIDSILENTDLLRSPEGIAALEAAIEAWDQSRGDLSIPDDELMQREQTFDRPSQ